jgi:hypothetical protein
MRKPAVLAFLVFVALGPLSSAHAASGHLETVAHAAPPESKAVDVRPHALKQRNFAVEAVLIDVLRQRGHAVEIGAPHIVLYQAEGTFSRMKGDNSWLRLYGSAGSASRNNTRLTLRLPDFSDDPATLNKYQISLTLEDQPGNRLWEALALYETEESDVAVVARIMVAAALDRWGQSYDGPLERSIHTR